MKLILVILIYNSLIMIVGLLLKTPDRVDADI